MCVNLERCEIYVLAIITNYLINIFNIFNIDKFVIGKIQSLYERCVYCKLSDTMQIRFKYRVRSKYIRLFLIKKGKRTKKKLL